MLSTYYNKYANYYNILPIALAVKGNKELLLSNNKKIYSYFLNTFSINGINNYKYFKNQMRNVEYINVCNDIRMIREEKSNIIILSLADFVKSKVNIKNKDLYIFTENLVGMTSLFTDLLFITEARYDNYIVSLVDSMINLGKEILVVPSNIGSHSYFSNYLIKQGADIILNKNDLVYYISK